MIHNIPQPEFEGIIATQLLKSPGLAEVRKNVSFTSLHQDSDHVITVVEDPGTRDFY
jgi:hypothetical protein